MPHERHVRNSNRSKNRLFPKGRMNDQCGVRCPDLARVLSGAQPEQPTPVITVARAGDIIRWAVIMSRAADDASAST